MLFVKFQHRAFFQGAENALFGTLIRTDFQHPQPPYVEGAEFKYGACFAPYHGGMTKFPFFSVQSSFFPFAIFFTVKMGISA